MNYPVKLSKREPRKQNTVILITHTSRKENEALKNYYLLLQRPKTGMYLLNDSIFFLSLYSSCNSFL